VVDVITNVKRTYEREQKSWAKRAMGRFLDHELWVLVPKAREFTSGLVAELHALSSIDTSLL